MMKPSMLEHEPAAVTLLNRQNADRPDRVQEHFSVNLRPGEVMAFVKYQEGIAGRRVLELDCGAGRVTRYLARWTPDVVGMDRSESLLGVCRRELASVVFRRGDVLDLDTLGAERFDAVLYMLNAIDLLAHSDRIAALAAIHRVLVPGGIFVFSSHNRLGRDVRQGPRLQWSFNPATFARRVLSFGRSVINRTNRKRYEHSEPEYALINDIAHEYSMIHYHIDYEQQAAQLARAGFDLRDAYGVDGALIGPTDDTTESFDIHYVARRV
jgi:SAM-dependent methyltransferase